MKVAIQSVIKYLLTENKNNLATNAIQNVTSRNSLPEAPILPIWLITVLLHKKKMSKQKLQKIISESFEHLGSLREFHKSTMTNKGSPIYLAIFLRQQRNTHPWGPY